MRVEKIRSGPKRDDRFEGERGVGVLHWHGGPDRQGSTMEVYKVEESQKQC